MTTNYQRSPLRSLYNYENAMAAANRGANTRMRGQLVQHSQQQQALPGLTDAEERNLERSATKSGLKYLTKGSGSGVGIGSSSAAIDSSANASYNVPTATENYIDSGGMDGGQSMANTPTDSEAYIDSGGMGQGESTSSSGTDWGGYLGGATGAYAGYQMGDYNNETDPAMYSGEDGFGRYNTTGFNKNYRGSYDNRAAWGGGTLGGVIGYFTEGAGNALITPVVRWFHPYAQDMTRDVINAGDAIGGAGGAMLLDPIGTLASGKYSSRDIAESGAEAAASGGLSLLGHSEPVSDFVDDIGDFFGW